jgi:hypothetical protein
MKMRLCYQNYTGMLGLLDGLSDCDREEAEGYDKTDAPFLRRESRATIWDGVNELRTWPRCRRRSYRNDQRTQ